MKSLNVLIVEDEAVLREVYEFVIKSHGHTVRTAVNGADGLKQLKALKDVDVVLLDIFMPVMDGKEFMRNLNVADYPNTKFIVCSNLSDRSTEAEMRLLGAHDYVVKANIDPQQLTDLIQNA